MKELSVREMRASIGRLDEIVAEAGEVFVSRRGHPVARILPMPGARSRPDHADLRSKTPRLSQSSAEMIRSERDER